MALCRRLLQPAKSLPKRPGTCRMQSSAAAHTRLDLSTPSPLIDLSACPSALLDKLKVQASEFVLYPNFLNAEEQDLLLKASLARLDASLSSEDRQARRAYKKKNGLTKVQGLLPDAAYGFNQSHFDQVITGYRETTCAEWPSTSPPELPSILNKIYSLLPVDITDASTSLKTPRELIAHILHLSSTGYISPHVDNIDASGTLIAGVSLNSERSLHLTYDDALIRVRLQPGSVYLQRDAMRYTFKHAIPLQDTWNGETLGNEQRISVMIRDRKPQK